jgi:hypothetical protein
MKKFKNNLLIFFSVVAVVLLIINGNIGIALSNMIQILTLIVLFLTIVSQTINLKK